MSAHAAVIWQTDYGESTVANRHMANWYMAKRRIPALGYESYGSIILAKILFFKL